MNRFIVLCGTGVWALAVAGCAARPPITTVHYEPPRDAEGMACVRDCLPRLAECQARCSESYRTCLRDVEPEARASYSEALEAYSAALAEYREDLRYHETNVWLGWGPYYDPWWFGYPHYRWTPHYIPPPLPPDPPSLAHETRRLIATRCDRDCGCQPIYDACYLGCGGHKRVITQP